MLPFTQEQFFEVFAGYNLAIWPVQVLAYIAGIATLVFVRSKRPVLQRAAWLLVGALWMWTGAAYFFMHFSKIGPSGPIFGLPFLVQGGLCVLLGLDEPWPVRTVNPLHRFAGVFLAVYAMLLYPVIGALTGHSYPAAPAFGVTPCPLVIFTFAVILLSPVHVPRWMLVVPLIWAVIGGSAAFLLGVPQDLMLPVSGALVLLLHWTQRPSRKSSSEAPAGVPSRNLVQA